MIPLKAKSVLIGVFIAVVLVVVIFKVYIEIKRLNELGFGQEVIITIYPNEIVDHTAVGSERKGIRDEKGNIINDPVFGSSVKEAWFDLWDETQRAKLVDYMKKNNVKIKPGKYKFSQVSYFEEVRKILKFEKINQ